MPLLMKKKKVLVLCNGNSGRSQMAEGWIRYYSGNAAEVYSAGNEICDLNMFAVKSMMDAVIDISHQKSKTIDQLSKVDFDFVITVCDEAREICPEMSGSCSKIHANFPDPGATDGSEEDKLMAFNKVRDDIEDFAFDFVHNNIKSLIPENIEELI
jgi:arsenate reductase (thioredoxin)